MKIPPPSFKHRTGSRGSGVVVVLALLSIMMILTGATFITARTLGSELKLIEKHQTERLNPRSPARKSPAHNLAQE